MRTAALLLLTTTCLVSIQAFTVSSQTRVVGGSTTRLFGGGWGKSQSRDLTDGEKAKGSRTRPIGAATLRPIGAISASSAGSEPSNHEATAFNLRERGVEFRPTDNQPPPDLTTCHAAFWAALRAALPKDHRYSEGNYNGLVTAVATQYQNETAFDMRLFEALFHYLGDTVAIRESNKASGRDQLSIIVLKGQWLFDGATYALGFSRQVTSEALGIPKDFGCSRTPRHDHSCVLLRKQREEENFSVVDASATVELKTSKKSCRLRVIKGENTVDQPGLSDRDGALSQVLAYTVSDVWTCLARKGMKIDGGQTPNQTPNRVRFGLLACKLRPKTTEEAKREAKVDEPLQKKKKPTSNPTWWALGDVIIPNECGGRFEYEVNAFGSFKSSNKEEATAAYLSVMTQGLQLLTSLKTDMTKTNPTIPEPYPLSGKNLVFGTEKVDTKSLTYTSPFSNAKTMEEVRQRISQGEFWRGTIQIKDLKDMCQQDPKSYDFCVVENESLGSTKKLKTGLEDTLISRCSSPLSEVHQSRCRYLSTTQTSFLESC